MLYESTAHALRDGMQQGEFTSTEITRSVLQKIEAQEPTINAFISIDAEGALEQAAAVDQQRADGADLGPLAGIPLASKMSSASRMDAPPVVPAFWRISSRPTMPRS